MPKLTKAQFKDRYVCGHCGARPPRGDYMVHNAVWARSGMGRGFLCLVCLDERLAAAGHDQLTIADFTKAPCNASLVFGYLLAVRSALKAKAPKEHR